MDFSVSESGIGSVTPACRIPTIPAPGSCTACTFSLTGAPPARLELVDIGGRRVLSREVGSLGAGRHIVNLSEGHRVAAGIYWVQLAQGAHQQRVRVTVIQ